MKQKLIFEKRMLLVMIVTLLLGLTSCAEDVATGPRTWIDSPKEGAAITMDKPLNVKAHVFARGGVAEIVLSVNGEAFRRDVPAKSGLDFVSIQQDWKPEKPGVYVLQVQGFDAQGKAAEPASVRVVVYEKTPPEVVLNMISVTPVITDTPTRVNTFTPTNVISVTPVNTKTPTTLPQNSSVSFYAKPEAIKAGECTIIYWNVQNAQRVIFGGIDQALSGSYKACLCKNELYTLRVVNLDGTEKSQSLTVAVKGTCATDTPFPEVQPIQPIKPIQPIRPIQPLKDTTPPTVPIPAVPANGLKVGCRSSQTLVWQPSTDDMSGVAGYYVKLEIQVKKGSWQSAAGYGPVSGKSVNANVQCGGIYRWMVRAQDKAGNASNWSSASTFSIMMD